VGATTVCYVSPNTTTNTTNVPWTGVADPGAYCDGLTAPDSDVLRQLDCVARKHILATRQIQVAQPVADELNASSAPTFAAYAGGQIQASLVDQWSALRRAQNAALAIENAKKAAALRINAGEATVVQLDETLNAVQAQLGGMTASQQTIAQKLANALVAAKSQCLTAVIKEADMNKGDGDYQYGSVRKYFEAADPVDPSVDRMALNNAGDAVQVANMVSACQSARAALDDARLQAAQAKIMLTVQGHQVDAAAATLEAARGNTVAEALEAQNALQRVFSDFDTATADVGKAGAQMSQLQTQAKLSVARAQLENSLSAQSAQLSLGLYRQYNQYDWWRARALLDGARRYAVAARRAIETSYVVDLSTLTAPEPFVAAPSSWAQDAYRYDLSMPAAVGLATGQTIAGAQYPNQVLDYVGNLERFVQGFAVERPITAAVDNQIISIPGPGSMIVVGGNVVANPARSAWSVLCPAGTTCAPGSSAAWCAVSSATPVAATCQLPSSPGNAPQNVAPLKARVSFYLDPWGRVLGHDALSPLNERANTRWGRLMVNLEGNNIVDCSGPSNPTDCSATTSYVTYDLRQMGPTLAFGATRDWTLLDEPTIQIEAGKAAALGQILDIQQMAWGQPFVEADARVELIGRPVNGTYTLELSGGSGVLFDNVTQVQILSAQSYSALQP
jgi:hypothetical protein